MIFIPPHPDTLITHPTSAVHYIMPCTWKCSCDWSKVHTGWLTSINGKTYHVEGDRKDGKEEEITIRNPNKKIKI